MSDLLMLALTVTAFLGAGAFARACQHLMRPGDGFGGAEQ
jgi:hypothetical protein